MYIDQIRILTNREEGQQQDLNLCSKESFQQGVGNEQS